MTASNQHPFLSFGILLARARKSIGLTTQQAADALKINKDDYHAIELGAKLPERDKLVILSALLKKDITEILGWTSVTQEEAQFKKSKYSTAFDTTTEFMEETIGQWRYKIPSTDFKDLCQKLKKQVFSTTTIPHLPENLVLIFEIISNRTQDFKHLSESTGFFPNGESLDMFLARMPHLGPRLFDLGNHTLFSQNKFSNLDDFYKEMSYENFKTLLLLALSSDGFYSESTDLPYLQQQEEFASLATLMARKLAPHLKFLNPHHFIMAVLAQNAGEQALFSILRKLKTNNGFPEEFLYQAIYELHPIVSAYFADLWGFPEEVCNEITAHHDRSADDTDPLADISPFGFAMKLVAFITNRGFMPLGKEEFSNLSGPLQKINLSLDVLNEVVNDMYKLRENLIEISTAVVSEGLPKRIFDPEKFQAIAKVDSDDKPYLAHKLSRKSPRLTPVYQEALLAKASDHLITLYKDMLFRKQESVQDFTKRMEILYSFHATLSS
ncbi:hypothetical protein K1X76_12370 [bacterium]|nr:hypothetical protein [bacterium]